MLTQEQIKNLKPGDPLIIHGTFVMVDAEGDICIKTSMTFCGHLDNHNRKYAHPSVVSIVKPKHDPPRLFKKGDRIRFKIWHGFLPSDLENGADLLGKEATVYEDQEEDEFGVHFLFDGEDAEQEWHAAYLPFIELVTPVEELEPYYVVEYEENIQIRRNPNGIEVARYDRERHPNALAAAEAERDRLNAEWRKKHAND